MNHRKKKNPFRKCEHCYLYYIRECPYDGEFPKEWYKQKRCKLEYRKSRKKELMYERKKRNRES